ncbi:MAG: PQQ-dependent sugar dehydrogenase [Acidimicrobiales bacterium]
MTGILTRRLGSVCASDGQRGVATVTRIGRCHGLCRVVLTATVAVLAVGVAGCGGDGDGVDVEVKSTIEFENGTEPAALAPLPDGGLLVGERRTGLIRTITADGDLTDPVAHVAVVAAANDQRGLLGLAVTGERIYAAWARGADGRIVVGEVSGDGERIVWEGPVSSALANGGHLAFLPDGRLLVGIGDLQRPELVDDPATPNGKLLALDAEGPPNQVPVPLSGGWNNPFAFVVTADGAIWVADNAPGDTTERIGRGDSAAGDRPALPGKRAPSALVELEPGRLGLCGYLDGQLDVVEIVNGEPRVGGEVATGCRTGAAALTDGRLAVSDGERVRILAED